MYLLSWIGSRIGSKWELTGIFGGEKSCEIIVVLEFYVEFVR